MDTISLHRNRINRVRNFARSSAIQDITLDNLADVACLSRYHFSRVFTSLCQETPIEFVSRVRLEQAVSSLIYFPERSITAIGLDAGFSSSQAFSNAFSRRFGIAPRRFRERNRWYVEEFPKNQYALCPKLARFEASVPSQYEDWNVFIRKTPAVRLAYIRRHGSYYIHTSEEDGVFNQLINWAKIRGLWREDSTIIGVCPDNSAVTPPQFCQYDVAMVVEDGVREDEHVCIQTIPEMTMAIMAAGGTPATGRAAWRYLISEWLPGSGLKRANHDYFEITLPDCEGEISYNSQVLLCMPVVSRELNILMLDPARLPSDDPDICRLRT